MLTYARPGKTGQFGANRKLESEAYKNTSRTKRRGAAKIVLFLTDEQCLWLTLALRR